MGREHLGRDRKQTCNNLACPVSGARGIILVKRKFVPSRYSINEPTKYLLNELNEPVFFDSLVHVLRMQLVHAVCFFIHFFC